MPKLTDHNASLVSMPRQVEMEILDRAASERVAGDPGSMADDLKTPMEEGPHGSDPLSERMDGLGVARSDAERIEERLMRDLQKTCTACCNKDTCKKDHSAQPDDPT